MPEATPFNLPFKEAVDFFRSKGYAISPNSWRDVWQQAHAQSFTVARVTAMDVLVDIREEAQRAFDDGISLGEFKKNLIPTLQRKGWWVPDGEQAIVTMPDGTTRKRLTPWRLETIYRTNLQVAYGTGRWKQIQEVKARRPYLQYKAIMDSRTRDNHAAMHDKVYPVDHPIWDTMTPSNGFNCRCYLKSLTAKQVESRGLPISDKAPDDIQADEGWDYNPGKAGLDAWKPDLKKYAPTARKALKKSLADPPKVPEIQIQKWTPAKTIKEAEAWAKNNLGVQWVSFKGLDVQVANDINRSVFNIKQVMPDIKTNGVGSAQEVHKAIKKELVDAYKSGTWYQTLVKNYGQKRADAQAVLWASKKIQRIGANTFAFSRPSTAYPVPGGASIDMSKYSGVFVNVKLGKNANNFNRLIKNSAISGWFTPDAKDFGYVMSHEIGHEIDKTIGFKSTPEFKAIFIREHAAGVDQLSKKLSTYGATAGKNMAHRPDEMIAECWAEFMTSPKPRPLSVEVSELMLKHYHKKIKTPGGKPFEEWKNEIMRAIQR